MRKAELDRLLERAVAEALGVQVPHRHEAPRIVARAVAPRRQQRHGVRELHPA